LYIKPIKKEECAIYIGEENIEWFETVDKRFMYGEKLMKV